MTSPPLSPMSARRKSMLEDSGAMMMTTTRSTVADETIKLQLQQFIDELHYRVLHCPLGKKWPRSRVLLTAIQVMVLNGCDIQDDEFAALSEGNEEDVICILCERMPIHLKDDIENLTLELQLVLQLVTRVRTALEAGDMAEMQELLESSSAGSLSQVLLQQTIVAASNDIVEIHRLQQTWCDDTAQRLERLSHAADMIADCEKELDIVDKETAAIVNKDFGKKNQLIAKMMTSGEQACLDAILHWWSVVAIQERSSRKLRQSLEAEIENAEVQLSHMKQQAMGKITGVALRSLAQGDENLLSIVFAAWSKDTDNVKREKQASIELQGLNAQVNEITEGMKKTTSSVLVRLVASSESSLINAVWLGWIEVGAQSKKERELEAKVSEKKKAVEEYRKRRKDEAKTTLERFATGIESGLLQFVFATWWSEVSVELNARKLNDMSGGQEQRYKSLQQQHVFSAKGVQTRISDLAMFNFAMSVLAAWRIEARVHTIGRYYTKKVDYKRRQLKSIESLFKSFAQQIEVGLGDMETMDSSARNRPTRTMSKGGSGCSSLPSLRAPGVRA
eukprot:TRINITY_DN5635_c0_g6_i1.p1 TRINITY_DN5635_c0_g6~~TRINITY_DN5635_c0_g6_i1.p1  ORF type:complete len:563 (+),score=113.56 TRINITY_DN5635_c0_g6_i1:42-1730(+)